MNINKELKGSVSAYQIGGEGNVLPSDVLDPTGVVVKPKWRGTSQDMLDMETLGRHQVLRVRE